MKEFSPDTRRGFLERAAEGVVDLLIVGGGITGAGVLRAARLGGYSALLVDKGDFASGTSSRSSKLIHGGVRYLQQGDIALVREAARERSRLHRMAPHLAIPVPMMIPAASRGGLLKLAAGLWTFDRLAGDPDDRHRMLGRDATRAAEPRLRRADRLAGSVVFTEYVTNDARLVLETVKAAALEGGLAANYVAVDGLSPDPHGLRASLVDRASGERFEVRARVVVNAAGPWMDAVRALGDGARDSRLQLTRGIHLVIPRERLPVEHIVVLRAPDGRSTFVVPAGRYAYIGTTDTHYRGEMEEPGVSAEDADYLLASVAAVFDDPPLVGDVIGTWSGVRPLMRQEGKAPSEISRRDEIIEGPGPMVSIAGGKLTTYCRMAERVLERAGRLIGKQPTQVQPAGDRPLFGGGLREQRQARERAPELADSRLADRLWQSYGCAAAGIVERIASNPARAEGVGGIEDLVDAEIEHCVRQEMVVHLDDLLRRRSRVAMFDGRTAARAAIETARRLGDLGGWDDARRAHEVESFRSLIDAELATVRRSS